MLAGVTSELDLEGDRESWHTRGWPYFDLTRTLGIPIYVGDRILLAHFMIRINSGFSV